MSDFSTLYFHGFASSPKSKKAEVFCEAFAAQGLQIQVPDLNVPSFSKMTITSMREFATELVRSARSPVILVGSSLGGYLASLVASQIEVQGLILMAPAFDIAERWRLRIGDDLLARWEEEGTIPVPHHAYGEDVPLEYDYYVDALRQEPYPDVGDVPTRVFHGRQDDVVPLECVEEFVRRTANAELVVYEDEHSLAESVGDIAERSIAFLTESLSR